MTVFAPAWASLPTDPDTDLPPLVDGGRPYSDPPWRVDGPAPAHARSRVLVVGDPSWPDPGAVSGHLTVAWRDAGQPLTVIHEAGCHPLGSAVRRWLAEHRPCGHVPVEYDPSPWRSTVAIRPRAWRVLAFGDGWGVRVAERAGLDVRRVTA